MSTLTEISPPKSRRSPVLRILLWLVLAVIVIVAGLVGYGYYVAHAALPQLDGRVQIRGLSAPVTVTRDGHGVPTIEAASLADLFFAQGYVTAQDRLWQMDVMRRFGGGELSEILGDDLLRLDREQRILGLRAAAKKSLELASPRDRAFYEAYARGVNAYIGTHGDRLPIEFRILHYCAEAMAAGRFGGHRQFDGEGSELSLLLRRAQSREDSGQAGAGVDRGLVCEPLVARPSADRDARGSERSRTTRGIPMTRTTTILRTTRSRT